MQDFAFLGWRYLGNANQSKFIVGQDIRAEDQPISTAGDRDFSD